ncbi:acid-sensing ion channel 5 [Brachionus plicatilis]|uniref:Acid-sensing ion channel 5 n=1 Tax=Brachionus plicatilis TaxID=10195 RepID=A0A3M7RZK7_BRAPC|nr:acid-sensing ion channel 5 [Brachionus plicatilis]
MGKNLVKIFREWTESISIHGFGNIFRTEFLTIRIIWTIALLASTGICLFIITLNVTNFLENEVITKIRVHQKNSLVFPSVTVCNLNPFATKNELDIVSYFLEKNALDNLTDSAKIRQLRGLNSSDLFSNLNMVRYLTAVSYKFLTINGTKINYTEIYDRMFITCLFGAEPCQRSDWSWFFDPYYGNCFTFNGKKVNEYHKSNQHGQFFGLIIELNVAIPNDARTLSISSGAHVYINHNPIVPLFGEGLDLSTGTYSNIALERTITKQMPDPYSECKNNLDSIDSFDSEYYRKVFKSNLTYRQTDCFNAYIQSQILINCFCNDLHYNLAIEGNNVCDTIEDQICISKLYQQFLNTNYQNEIKKFCPLECETVSFNIKKSESKYPSESYGYSFKSVSWDGLVGSVGGTLGLFLGMSALSFVEFIDLFFQLILNSNQSKVKGISTEK